MREPASGLPRINDQQQIWIDKANQLHKIIEWSGLLNLKEQPRNKKLPTFFIAQTKNMEFEGAVVTDANRTVVFDFQSSPEMPQLQAALRKNHGLW